MRRLLYTAFADLIRLFTLNSSVARVPAVDHDTSLRAFLPQFEEGIRRFINGDPSLWKHHASHRDNITILGGWGGYESGWNEVGPRYDWAAMRFKPSGAEVQIEYLASGISGDLAYTVAIERSNAHVIGQDAPAPMALRVTHIFRKEDDTWKLVHRHADYLINKTAPASVLQQPR